MATQTTSGVKEKTMITFGYTITYVPNVEMALSFYERAFGFHRRFLHEGGDYGELETGGVTLAFAAHSLGATHFPAGYVAASDSAKPLGMELDFVATDIDAAHQKGLDEGATEIAPPTDQPWGQRVSWLRCPSGVLVGLGSPMNA